MCENQANSQKNDEEISRRLLLMGDPHQMLATMLLSQHSVSLSSGDTM